MVPDAAGNPATINGETLVWNAQNMLVARGNTLPEQLASGVNYLDWSGKRVMRWFPPTALIFVGDDFEYDAGLGMSTKHFFLNGERVAARSVFYTAQSAWLPPLAYRWLLEPLRAAAPGLVLAALALGLLSLLLLGFGVPVPAWVGAPAVGLLAAALVLYPTSAAYAVIGTGGGPEWHGGHSKPLVIYGNDHLGSTRVVIDAAGETVETRDYAPFGKTVAHTGAYDLRHRFTSQPWDDAGIGLYDYGARMYEPRWGRFLSPDERAEGFSSQGLNRLAYARNRPASRIDPGGRLSIGEGLGGSFGGSFGDVATLETVGAFSAQFGQNSFRSGSGMCWGRFCLDDFQGGMLLWDEGDDLASRVETIASEVRRLLEGGKVGLGFADGGPTDAADALEIAGVIIGTRSDLLALLPELTEGNAKALRAVGRAAGPGLTAIGGARDLQEGLEAGDPVKVVGGGTAFVLGAGAFATGNVPLGVAATAVGVANEVGATSGLVDFLEAAEGAIGESLSTSVVGSPGSGSAAGF